MYLIIRALHVLMGAIWVGFAVFSALFLMPMAADLGPDMAKVAAALERRRFMVVVPVVATTAVLSGVWLYWRYTAGFSAEVSRTHAAMAFGTGGVLAIVALLIGALVISRAMMKATAIGGEAAKASNPNERAKLLAEAGALRQRAAIATRIVAGLVVLTIILMSVALYL